MIYPNTDKPKKSIESKKKSSSSGLAMLEGSHIQQYRQTSNQLADQFKIKDGRIPSLLMQGGTYEAVLTTKKTS